MEPSGSTYLYALAAVSITFVGFSALLMIFRQARGDAMTKYEIQRVERSQVGVKAKPSSNAKLEVSGMNSGPGAPEGRGPRAGTALRLMLSAVLFAVGLLALFIENAGQLGEFAPTFAGALNAVDPFYLLRQQWFRIWCALGVHGVHLAHPGTRILGAAPIERSLGRDRAYPIPDRGRPLGEQL